MKPSHTGTSMLQGRWNCTFQKHCTIKEVLDAAADKARCLTWGPLCQRFCSAQISLVEAFPPSSL